MTFTVFISRQLWFQRLLGVFVPIIFLTCGIGHFLEGLSYWHLTFPLNVPWTMVTADIGFAVLVNSARFPTFIRGQDVEEELRGAKQRATELEANLAALRRSEDALRASEGRLRLAQHVARLGCWEYDLATGKIIWSEEMFHLLDLDPAQGEPDYVTAIAYYHPEDAARLDACIQSAITEGKGLELDLRRAATDGQPTRWFHAMGQPVLDAQGKVIRLTATLMDISDRKIFEQTLHEKNLELERANLAKDRFLASMSHELRTPLNAILGFTGTILMRLPGPLNDDQERQLTIIKSSAKHLLSLINDLLELARIESGTLELPVETVACHEVVAEVAAELRPLAEGKGLVLDAQLPASPFDLQGNRRALHQILLNLTNNAIKFTERGSVHLRVERTRRDDRGQVEFRVIDTGIGIREEDREHLFKAFSRLNRGNGQVPEGTGLGLHLSQMLAGLMGGHIHCESEYGKGSIFTLVLRDI